MQDPNAIAILTQSADTLFVLGGAIMVLAMHSGFAFLELGTVRSKNQVNALVKIITDFGISTLAYFFIGYWLAYGKTFFADAPTLAAGQGYELVKFFFLLTFAAAIPAIVSGGIAERARFYPMLLCSGLTVGLVYPLFEGIAWNGNFGLQAWLELRFGAPFHDFAGSVVVHAVGGWIGLVAVVLLGMRKGRIRGGQAVGFAPSNIPMLALGAWVLTVGWFGFNVMSAQKLGGISGLVALNSLMAMVGGTLVAMLLGRNDPGFIHNGPLAGLVAVCAGSDLMHPLSALLVGGVAGAIFIGTFTWLQRKRPQIDDVLGVWPLHGLCGAWGGIAAGIFGHPYLGGMGGVSLSSQLIGTGLGILTALCGGGLIYGLMKRLVGLRLSEEEEFIGADLAIHHIAATNRDKAPI